jgi:hypothetical protein
MRLVDATRPGLITQEIKPGRGVRLPEGRWGSLCNQLLPDFRPMPTVMPPPPPLQRTAPVAAFPQKQPVTMADKANKVI